MQPNTREIDKKHKNLLNLIQFLESIFQLKDEYIQANLDSINKGVIENEIRLPTKNAMFMDDNLIANA